MLLRALWSNFRSAVASAVAPRPRTRVGRRLHLRCEPLEGRELPAANLMGVNLSGVDDWSTDRMFADAMKSSRRPSDLRSHLGTPPIDANGWPATDASIVVFHGIGNMNGTYKLSFTGQADVWTSWGAASIVNKVYNSATNTTTADLIYFPRRWLRTAPQPRQHPTDPRRADQHRRHEHQADAAALAGLHRQLRPVGHVHQPLKDLVSRFTTVRMMDNTGSNGAAGLNGSWANRRPTSYASQISPGHPSKGMAWEFAIQFWNETDKDAWVNIPFPADEQYITQLATLLKNNLEPGRKIYVEYSNELWNTWGPFPGMANHDAAVAEVRANPNSPLNFDGIYPSRDPDGWELAKRRIAFRAVQTSNIFRQVFGDAEMMTRVRPVLMSQLGYTAGWLAGGLDFIEDYFNNPTFNASSAPRQLLPLRRRRIGLPGPGMVHWQQHHGGSDLRHHALQFPEGTARRP